MTNLEKEQAVVDAVVDRLYLRFLRINKRFLAPFKVLRGRLIIRKIRKAIG